VKIGPVYFVVQIDGVPADDEIQKPARAAKKDETATSIEELGDGEEIEETGEEALVENAEEAPGDAVEDFDPMTARSGSDSGLNMEEAPGGSGGGGDSMQIPIDGEDEKK